MLWLLHRRTDEVAPFRPRSVVVLHVLEAEQMFQHEPRQTRAFADAAIRDDWRVAFDALIGVQLLQLVHAFERSVVVAVLPPRNALRAGNVTAALARLRKSGWREDFPREFRGAADVDQRGLLLRRRLLHIGKKGAQRDVWSTRFVGFDREGRFVRAQLSRLGEPLLPAAVHDAY